MLFFCFPNQVVQLLPKTEQVVKLSAVCRLCGDDANFSLRKVQNTEVQLIGGDDMYMAVCRSCYQGNNQFV